MRYKLVLYIIIYYISKRDKILVIINTNNKIIIINNLLIKHSIMLKFEINGAESDVLLSLPTKLSEITPEYLNEVTANVYVADDYTLIGILYRESLGSVVLANTQKKKNITTSIVPIFVKAGKTYNDFVKYINVCEKLIISPSDIAMGHHVTCPKNKLSINTILEYCQLDKDSCRKAIVASKDADPCYFLEFKLVPNCNIHGAYSAAKNDYVNPFVKVERHTGSKGNSIQVSSTGEF